MSPCAFSGYGQSCGCICRRVPIALYGNRKGKRIPSCYKKSFQIETLCFPLKVFCLFCQQYAGIGGCYGVLCTTHDLHALQVTMQG